MAATLLMSGKTVLITGGTGGIGKAAAIGLASMGARVGITGRDRARAERAASRDRAASRAIQRWMFSSPTCRRRPRSGGWPARFSSAYPRLDVLVNNVGGFWAHRHVTADGLEHTFALNHLAPFLLTSLLLERLMASAPARVVTVSSGAQAMGRIDFDDLMGEQEYSGQRAYNQSKLANVMFTYELATATRRDGCHRDCAAPRHDQHRRSARRTQRARWRPSSRRCDRSCEAPRRAPTPPSTWPARRKRKASPAGTSSTARRRSPTSPPTTRATTARLWQVSADLVGVPVDSPR